MYAAVGIRSAVYFMQCVTADRSYSLKL